MSFPRLALVLTAVLGLPLLTGACGAPAAVGAASYGSDGVSMVGTGKSTTDHFASMVSKRDCALWRVFRNQNICREQEGNPNPYHVDYTTPQRDIANGEPEYLPPLRAPADAPPASWNAAAYAQPSSQETAKGPSAGQPAAAAPTVTAEATPAPAPVAATPPAPAKAKKKSPTSRSAKKSKPKLPPAAKPASPDPAAPAL